MANSSVDGYLRAASSGGVQQPLEVGNPFATVASGDGDGGGEVAAGAVAAHGDRAVRPGGDGEVGGEGVVGRGGEGMLRRPPVPDGDHADPGELGEVPARAVVAVDGALDPSAAMEEHERPVRTIGLVAADRHASRGAVRTRNGPA